MRIAMIGHKEFPSRSGGVEVVVNELATRLAENGHDVTVYNRGRQKRHNRYDEQGVHVRRVFTFKRESLNAMVYSFLATFRAVSRKYAIYHYHAIGPSVPLLIAHLLGKKTVATVHGLNWRVDKWGSFASRYLKLGEKIIARYADEVIVLSEDMRKYFMDTYGRETDLIENAVTPITFCEGTTIKEKFGLEKDNFILYVGRISPEKGIQDLIDGYKLSGLKITLAIAGQIPDNDFGAEIRRKVEGVENIVFTGFAGPPLLRELYSNCALYVLPSHTEGLALTLLEAMSCGCRCLVSDIPENTLVTKGFASTFKAGDIPSLAAELGNALAEPVDAEKRKAEMDYINERYNYGLAVDRLERLYRGILKTNRKFVARRDEMILSILEKGEIRFQIQPFVDLERNRIVGGEVLSRLYHPDLGLLMPGEFLKIVNEKGLCCKFDYTVFDNTCKLVEKFAKNSVQYGTISCNFSRRTLSDPDFISAISSILDRYELDLSTMAIEIVEYDSTTDEETMVRNLEFLHGKGMKLFLDDFGSGFSVITDVCRYPIDSVKLDRSFLTLADSSKALSVCQSLIMLMDKLNISVICEGAESIAQVKELINMGCKFIQGYYFYSPMNPDAFEKLLLSLVKYA